MKETKKPHINEKKILHKIQQLKLIQIAVSIFIMLYIL